MVRNYYRWKKVEKRGRREKVAAINFGYSKLRVIRTNFLVKLTKTNAFFPRNPNFRVIRTNFLVKLIETDAFFSA